jgi:chemotaxis protein methyltransferase CheR
MTPGPRIVRDGELDAIVSLVRERAGLEFSAARLDSAATGVDRAMARMGVDDPTDYRKLIANDAAAMDDLLAELTVGESYFFREPAQFDFLRNEILPSLSRNSGGERQIRVWSAGCSTGEEPYSVAIAVAESGLAPHVLGTDVSRSRLALARRGRYRRWSLRGVPESVVSRYFRRQGDEYQLLGSVRQAVEFRYLNLASDTVATLARLSVPNATSTSIA